MDRVCIYIAYNGKWTADNKYLDHETKLVLVNDDITFDGLIEKIFHVLKLNKDESEVDIWFETKLETSKGMLVTNDEEVTSCIYLLKNDSDFKTSRFIVDLLKISPLLEINSTTNLCTAIVPHEKGIREIDMERQEGSVVIESTMELDPTPNEEDTGQTSNIRKLRKRLNGKRIGKLSIKKKRRPRSKRNIYPMVVLRENASLDEIVVGSVFEDKQSLKRCFLNNSVKNQFKFKVSKSSKIRYWLKCYDKECSWYVRCAKVRDSPFFKICKFQKNHSCSVEVFKSDQRHITSKVISDYILELPDDAKAEIRPNIVVEEMSRKYGLSISYHKAWRAIQHALAATGGCLEENHERGYLEDLERRYQEENLESENPEVKHESGSLEENHERGNPEENHEVPSSYLLMMDEFEAFANVERDDQNR